MSSYKQIFSKENEDERVKAIAEFARQLDMTRNIWLNPKGIGITFQKSIAEKRTLTNLYNALEFYRNDVRPSGQRNAKQWDKDVESIISLDDIEVLDSIHNLLDRAVYDAYGWPYALSDEQILERLLTLNKERTN